MLPFATGSALSVVILSFALAAFTGDAHWCQRGGALLAAIAAFLAIFEASVEHNFRKFETAKVTSSPSFQNADDTSLNLLNRIRLAKFRSAKDKLSYEKMKAVFWISSIAILGEFLHGFGDLLYELGVMALHSVAT
jgi:hypothetical protein